MPLPLQTTKKPARRNPKVILNSDDLAHLEGLADRMMKRHPDLADRLFDEIGRARIVAPAKIPANVVTMGSTVTYRDETTGKENSVTLVYPEEADIAKLRVSVMTPIGIALLGLAEGAGFHWNTRDNERRTLTILEVRQPVADA